MASWRRNGALTHQDFDGHTDPDWSTVTDRYGGAELRADSRTPASKICRSAGRGSAGRYGAGTICGRGVSWATAEGEAAGATVRTTAGVAVARVWFGLDLLKAAETHPPGPEGL
ncbi:hypothetical protein GCM10023170_025860 [Phytohabitans houttuyneae]|uniref:Uncharacterized protein n=1 Tax=Phytohabitans houttuyneae TaxID=1076126 RepID=A0A6V8KGB2_9ACTN|nr:hypothetical protein Phou_070240 [Phytohabitans houttuyneae]